MSDSNIFSLKGRVALVTGSSKGLGKAMAFALARQGARVAVNYAHGREKAEQTFAELQKEGFEGGLFQADITDETACNQLISDINRQLGPVDVMVLNATCDQPHESIEKYDWAFYQTMIDFFIKSPYLLTRAALPHMKAQKWGRIINIGTEVFLLGVPNFSAYAAAKGGQNAWTRSMATELAPWRITVNMISPGWIPVERHVNEPQEWKDAYFPTIPLGRWGVPNDLSGAVSLLASEAGSFITGHNLVVNGGRYVS
jgi:3-oxoacyl-[acyl-carrier protein] reductase